jgi:hypothetical protein
VDVLLTEDSETDAKLIVHELLRIGLAPRTHRAQIMERLEVRHIGGLIRYAIKAGIAEQ